MRTRHENYELNRCEYNVPNITGTARVSAVDKFKLRGPYVTLELFDPGHPGEEITT